DVLEMRGKTVGKLACPAAEVQHPPVAWHEFHEKVVQRRGIGRPMHVGAGDVGIVEGRAAAWIAAHTPRSHFTGPAPGAQPTPRRNTRSGVKRRITRGSLESPAARASASSPM